MTTLEKDITLPSLRLKLQQGGYESLEKIKKASVYDLTQELQLTKEEVNYLIKISGKEHTVKRTIAEIIAIEQQCSISTSCKGFNTLLGYGVPPFKITEICGESGSGKSQLCMQLAVNVQLPKSEGGVEGECIYIDTEGSFQCSRIIQMARTHGVERILKGIHVFRVLDHKELIALVRQLPEVIKEYSKVKLIIIDSIVYHFRLNAMDSKARLSTVEFFAQFLIELANVNQLAVVVTNHVTMDGTDQSWTPSLGSSWGYWCANRLFLYRKREYRYGYLYKSIENAGSEPVPFCIKDEGIIDPDQDELELPKQESETEAEINKKIESTWEEMKSQQVKEEFEAERIFDDLWDETVENPIPSSTPSPIRDQKVGKRKLDDASDENACKLMKSGSMEALTETHPISNKDTISTDNPTTNIPNSDNEWASEEELDLDFLENVYSYF